MSTSDTPTRVKQLGTALKAAGMDAFFAHSPVTTGYLHGLHEHAGERFMTLAISSEGEVRLIAPALSETQARRAGIQDVQVWKDGEDPLALFRKLSKEWNLESAILAVDDELPAQMLLKMQSALPAALFKAGGAIVGTLISRKQPDELKLMYRAGAIADEAFDEVLPKLRAGLSELEVERLLNGAMTKRGGQPAFCIVAAGPGAAEPHHLSDGTVIKDGDVLILDFGCDFEGYKSDITRTVAIGKASPGAKKVYEIVYKAHMSARNAILPGATGESVDQAARKVIEDAGYGEQFFHRTGHGIGMRVHEEPNIVKGNVTPLEPGNCFSIEPGIYLVGRFGVRIENIVAATADGHESFNANPSATLIETA